MISSNGLGPDSENELYSKLDKGGISLFNKFLKSFFDSRQENHQNVWDDSRLSMIDLYNSFIGNDLDLFIASNPFDSSSRASIGDYRSSRYDGSDDSTGRLIPTLLY